jgi:hypothetical protein
MTGDLEDVPELQQEMRKQRASRDALDRRLAGLSEPIDRAALRAALDQRAADWRERLRSEYPDEARFVVQQLIGPLTLRVGTAEDLETFEGCDPDDRRGKEEIEFEDCGFTAVVTPRGLLNGLVAVPLLSDR